MKGRYLIVFLLLGGVVYGLTTVVSSMLAEENPMSASSVSVDWSSVPDVGTSSRVGGSSVSVPMSSRSANRLFHHPVAYAVSAPQGSAHSGSVSGYAAGGYPAAGGASQGVYLTTSSSLQSYGGGAESGVYTSAGSHSAMSSASSSASSVMSSSGSMGTMGSGVSLAPSSSFASPSYAYAYTSTMSYASSVQQSAPRRNGQRRTPGTIAGNDEWERWFDWYVGQDDATGGWTFSDDTYYFTEEQLRAAYEYWKANQSGMMPTVKTFEDWLAWITGESNNTRYQLSPIGDGIIVLLLLSMVYMIAILYKQYKMNRKIHTL